MKPIYLIIIVPLLALLSCRSSVSTKEHKGQLLENKIIDVEGDYYSNTRNITLAIKVINNIVTYSVLSSTGKTLFNSDSANNVDSGLVSRGNEEFEEIKGRIPRASDFQRWCFLLDGKGNIWFESSDIGLYVLILNQDSKYRLVVYHGSLKKLPEELYKALPGSYKEEKVEHRKH